jgi:catechol 2,3-dioxygenase-like lactoylglutathione lyase family enzyme
LPGRDRPTRAVSSFTDYVEGIYSAKVIVYSAGSPRRTAIQLNHTIVHALDPNDSAKFLAEILGLGEPKRFGPFVGVEVQNGVTLDFIRAEPQKIIIEHYAFLVSEEEFDEIFAHAKPGEINRKDGGRGLYWNDPNGHYLEIITRPYGSGA